MIKQISVFIENKSGRMAEATRVIADAGVNVRALAVADTSDFGVLRLIADDPGKAIEALKSKGFTAMANDVLAVKVPDQPGGLAQLLESLSANGINVEYLYAFFEKTRENAVIILKVDDVEKTTGIFQKGGIVLISAEEISKV